MNGYTGKILHVDLSTGAITVEEPPDSFYRRYMGGSTMVGYYLLKEIPKGADPLGPENVVVFAGGPMTGVPIGGAGRSAVGAKSPLNGGYGEADSGGFLAPRCAVPGLTPSSSMASRTARSTCGCTTARPSSALRITYGVWIHWRVRPKCAKIWASHGRARP